MMDPGIFTFFFIYCFNLNRLYIIANTNISYFKKSKQRFRGIHFMDSMSFIEIRSHFENSLSIVL